MGLMLKIAVALFVFLAGVLFIQHLGDGVLSARTGLDCSNAAGISDGTKLTCLFVDVVVPYFILLLLSITFAWVGDLLT